MHVNVKHGLPDARARIDDGSETALAQSLLVGDARRDVQQMSERAFVRLPCVVERLDVIARDDEGVDGRLRIHVAEGDAQIVFVKKLRGDFARDNTTEDAALRIHNKTLTAQVWFAAADKPSL